MLAIGLPTGGPHGIALAVARTHSMGQDPDGGLGWAIVIQDRTRWREGLHPLHQSPRTDLPTDHEQSPGQDCAGLAAAVSKASRCDGTIFTQSTAFALM